jgi:hypothetical protein
MPDSRRVGERDTSHLERMLPAGTDGTSNSDHLQIESSPTQQLSMPVAMKQKYKNQLIHIL